ncbi:hypothetical protein FG386_000640 [Cryptosporidium ryanae]|uniref:uncharacterized protein n=1 Tax=Cryptosporidium ryanae TaxID=515981 RepID=UPI00351A0658|nr:hypothetical protein FG386_000640 [Cryptosporidium ryanae]
MRELSRYSKEISKIRESISYSLLENKIENKQIHGRKKKRENDRPIGSIDISNVSESFAKLTGLGDPAECDIVLNGKKDKFRRQILGLINDKNEEEVKTKNKTEKVNLSRNVRLDTNSRLGLNTYIYSDGREWEPTSPSLMWRKGKDTENTTTLPCSIADQQALMNSPGMIRELENELGPVKTSIKLSATGEKLYDVNVGELLVAKEVWKDEPLKQIAKVKSLESELIGTSASKKSKENLNPIYEELQVPGTELVTLKEFGGIKLPVRTVANMINYSSDKVERTISEKEGSLEMKLLNLVDPMYLKEKHDGKSSINKLEENNIKQKELVQSEINDILFGEVVNEKLEERYINDVKWLRLVNTNFEKHLGIKLSERVSLENFGDASVKDKKDRNGKIFSSEFVKLRKQFGWETADTIDQTNNEVEYDIYGKTVNNKSTSDESIVSRLIQNTTLYPCFDEVLFENSFRIHPKKRLNSVSLITDHLDATSIPDSADLLIGIHKRQYTPPLAENFPKGLPSQVQDPRIIWQKEFLEVPYDITADLIRKIQAGSWDEIANDIAKSSYGSIQVKSLDSIASIKKLLLNELSYNTMYSVDEPFDVSPPKLSRIEREQVNKGIGNKTQFLNNKLILTPKSSILSQQNKAMESFLPSNPISGILGGSNLLKENKSGEADKKLIEKFRNNASVITSTPDSELYEIALWNRYEFPHEDSNKGTFRKFKLGKMLDGEPLTRQKVIEMSSLWDEALEKQSFERKEGLEILKNFQLGGNFTDESITNLSNVTKECYNSMNKKDIKKITDMVKEYSESIDLSDKFNTSTQDSKKAVLGQGLGTGGAVGGIKGISNLLISGMKNFSGATLNNRIISPPSNLVFDEGNNDSIKANNTQNNIFKKIKPSQKTNKNYRGNKDSMNNYDDDDDEYSSVIDEYSEEFEDLSTDNEEDYSLLCAPVNVQEWEPTNLMMTKSLFKYMDSVFVTLSSVLYKDRKIKYRVEVYELSEHGIIVWMGRDKAGIREKFANCCNNEKGKLRVKGGIYITPDTIISPIEPCTEIPGNYSFTVTGVSLSQLVFKGMVTKQLEFIKKYISERKTQTPINLSENDEADRDNLKKSGGNNLQNNGTRIESENYLGRGSSLKNQRHCYGINIDINNYENIFDKNKEMKKINDCDILELIPILNSKFIPGVNTILVSTKDPFLRGVLPLSIKGLQNVTIKFSLRRNRLLLWRSIKCQIWRIQYIDLCLKSYYLPSKKMLSFITNSYSKISSSNSFDMGGIKFQENIFLHCINVALSRRDPKEIIFRGCYMGDDGFSKIFPLLKHSKSLGKLDLGMNNLTARSLPLILEVVKNSNCKKLWLDFNNIGPNKTKKEFALFIKHILFSTSIENINLSRNKINGRCIDFLDTIIDNLTLKNKNLETLSWCSNGNTQPEIETLLLALQPCCIKLSKVYLGGNYIERIDAFRRRFHPIHINMEDTSTHYLMKQNNSRDNDTNY